MAKKLMTNCPNCGAPLRRDGTCEYCGTKARYANELDINLLSMYEAEPIELELRMNMGDSIVIMPMVGTIDSINIQSNSTCTTDYTGQTLSVIRGETNVDFTFSGHLIR